MNKILQIFALCLFTSFVSTLIAGNPDRQGEAGAYELLMNPWARSSGVNGMNVSYVSGVEANWVNPAGLGRINKTQVVLCNTRWLVPSGISINAFGLSTKVGKNGTLGLALTALSFGDIAVTTTEAPEGTGATYSPNFFNIGLGYSHMYGNKVSVGFLVRGVSESIQDLNAFGLAIDAGVQYVAGQNDNFKLGISLRNIGSPMKFSGEGLATQLSSSVNSKLTYEVRPSKYELPSLLNIGVSYNFKITEMINVMPLANFTSNSFGRDKLGVGAELGVTEYFRFRTSYKTEIGKSAAAGNSAPTGLSAGISLSTPIKKKSDSRLSLDYAYRPSNPFQGTHNIGLRFDF